MDNITHSLVGLAVAEAAVEYRRQKSRETSPTLRYGLWACSVAANNLCDLDFLYTGITGGKLGYLLHHRGHTHTLIAAVPQSLLVILVLWAVTRLKRIPWRREEWRWVWGLALAGPLIHLALDAMNSYGVHPFWPFDRRWHYGDTLFIIEPWLWVTLSAGMWPLLRLPLLFVSVVTLLLCWLTGYVSWPFSLAVSTWAVLLVTVSFYRRHALATRTLVMALAVVLIFHVASRSVKIAITELYSARYPQLQLHDVILSPMPANPLCWFIITVDTGSAGSLHLRSGMVAAMPGILPATDCPRPRGGTPTLPLVPVASWNQPRVLWRGEWETKLSDFTSYAKSHCGFAAFLRYARAPFLLAGESSLIAGDLRFDREEGLGFAEIRFPWPAHDCPKFVPTWIEPRRDLLDVSTSSRKP